jgi:hypothetical protein
MNNPFVASALTIIAAAPEATLGELVELLAEREPALSPLNLECAARAALALPRPPRTNEVPEEPRLSAPSWRPDESPDQMSEDRMPGVSQERPVFPC